MTFIPLILALMSTGTFNTLTGQDYSYSVPVTCQCISNLGVSVHGGDEFLTLNQYFVFQGSLYFNTPYDCSFDITSIEVSIYAYDENGSLLDYNEDILSVSDFTPTGDDVINITPSIDFSNNEFDYAFVLGNEDASLSVPLSLGYYWNYGYIENFVPPSLYYTLPFTHLYQVEFPNLISSILYTSSSYDLGYQAGKTDGYSEGFQAGEYSGKQIGYADGIEYAHSQDHTALTIFTGICTVAMLPVNMFLTIFNFEVFGINIGGFISSFLTIAIVIIIIRMVTGKKSDD